LLGFGFEIALSVLSNNVFITPKRRCRFMGKPESVSGADVHGKKGAGKVVGVIPVRYDSSRLPGKPLSDILGKPMVQWVYEGARRARSLDRLMVATDDRRIFQCVEDFGGEVVMTPSEIPSGTDRAAWTIRDIPADIVVNIQGDEPFIRGEQIDAVARILLDDPQAVVGTLIRPIHNPEDLDNPNSVKVVVDDRKRALYFSRSPIPFCRDRSDRTRWLDGHTYWKHIGLYSFRKIFLMEFTKWKPSPLETIEKLEQLRVLEKGYPIHVAVSPCDSVCVDTPDDLNKVREMARKK
jgi:3-deoxy-manno-octulosonate cytidylyltransferase (CMP-KDO synthetase)